MKELIKQKNNKRRKERIWIVVVVLLLASIFAGCYAINKLTAFQHVSLDRSDEALGIEDQRNPIEETKPTPTKEEQVNDETNKWNGKIVNIALFGLDRRSSKEVARSDSIMILTIDFQHNKIKLTSLMRDMDVPIEGHGTSKLNHAYAYGGAKLAIKTINQNFGTDIRDYIAVDFFTLEKIIDSIGGVPINVKEKEIKLVNEYMNETSRIQNKKPTYLKSSGFQTLNGMQAVSYARIRYVGNGDFERTERQRTVLMAMINKAKEQGVSAVPSLLLEVTPYVETTLERSDILSLAYKYFKEGDMQIEQERFPLDGTWKSGRNRSGGWVMDVDMTKMKEVIRNYIYRDIDPTPDTDDSKTN
ncbi:LCP family protein [Brevibacillus sp. NPDC058079]|uniref:LCP family protein n=1 Tax=Brevibacillus sp. NPDC058079 TaxID=3346330 RepID=UPI0036E11DAF